MTKNKKEKVEVGRYKRRKTPGGKKKDELRAFDGGFPEAPDTALLT